MDDVVITDEVTRKSTKETNKIDSLSKLVSVKYPAIVQNADKALETLGGIDGIEAATSNTNQDLHLNFHPKSIFSKSVSGDRDLVPNMVIKLKVKKTLANGKVIQSKVVDYDVSGITAVNYSFNKVMDFQYLPVIPKQDVEKEVDVDYVYNKIVPETLPDHEWLMSEDSVKCPVFMPPNTFAKHNTPGAMGLHFPKKDYFEHLPKELCKQINDVKYKKYVESIRVRSEMSAKYTHNISVTDPTPTEPKPEAVANLKSKGFPQETIDLVRKCFEKRPIWSRHALLYETKVAPEPLKFIIGTVAYYFTNGPWRVMWVKIGYDPRVDPNARIYQMFDYRVNALKKLEIAQCTMKTLQTGQLDEIFQKKNRKRKKSVVTENMFRLREGMLPASRQMFYQYCDIDLPEVKAMVRRLPPITSSQNLHESNGWLPNFFIDQCREVVNKYVDKQLQIEAAKLRNYSAEATPPTAPVVDEEPEECYEISSSSDEYEEEDTMQQQSDSEEGPDNDTAEEIEFDTEALEDVNELVGIKPDVDAPGPSNIKSELLR